MRAARQANTLAPAATRLNYDTSGFRSLLFATGRGLPDQLSTSARETLIEIDPRWGEVETWGVISRASGPVTSLFVLAAVDLRRTAGGEFISARRQARLVVV